MKNVDGTNMVSAVMELKMKEKEDHSRIIEKYGGYEGVVFIAEV